MAPSRDEPPIGGSRNQALVLTVILLLLMVTVLRAAAALLLPIAVSLLLMFLLGPVVRWLHGRGMREGIAAALVVFGTVGALGTGVVLLAGPAATWLREAPATVAKVESRLRKLRRSISGLEKTAEQIQRVADAPTGAKTATIEVRAPGGLAQLGGSTINAAASVLTVTFLTYFLLASGRLFRAKIRRMVGNTDRQEGMMAALGQIETHMSRYLVLTSIISAVVGAATWGLLAAVGLPSAMLLGAVALVLNFIPYVGALVTLVLILVASLVTFDAPQRILLAGGGFVAINLLEGNLVTPLVLGHKLPVNVVAIFVGLLFWSWVWGIPGAIMAVPLTVMIQVICANVERWHRVAILLDN
jgi:predicted PurR-regulated permease PerM